VTKKNSLYILITAIIIIGLYFLMMPDNNNTQNRVDIVNAQTSPAVVSLYQNNCASCHGKNLQGQVGWQNQLDDDGHRLAPPLNMASQALIPIMRERCLATRDFLMRKFGNWYRI